MTENAKPGSIPKNFLFAPILAMAVFFIATSAAFAKPSAQASDGETLFKEKCAACHTIGGGDLVGPDLQGVTERRDPAWLAQWILAPDQVLAAGDPIATDLLAKYKNIPMPNLALTPAQVDSLLAYLGSGASVGGSALPTGDAARGKALFVGDARFENGGPHCMSCHSIAGIGSLGNLGPDLTANGYTKYGDGLAAFLSSPPTVTMNAVWKDKPLTAQEQADLFAFMKNASVSQREPGALLQIALLAIAGAAALMALAQVYWGKRLRGVRKPMIERAYAAAKRK
jgi:cytochrome c2